MRRFSIILLVCAALTVFVDEALAEGRRVALVVGVGAYENVPVLPNAVNDATAMGELFRKAGFEVVTARTDLGNLAFKRAIREFEETVTDSDMAIVFYAGHGIEVHNQNYLIPTDAKLAKESDVEDETISLDRIITSLEAAKRLRLVILDACRDNPFASKMRRRVATRGITAGLGKVEPAQPDTLIAYAAKDKSVANDGDGDHSPFTTALLNNLTVPGLDIRIAFGRIRDEVLKTTGYMQEPFLYGSLGGGTVALVPAPAVAGAGSPDEAARNDYTVVERLSKKEAWEAFLSKHSTGLYADLARMQLAKLGVGSGLPVISDASIRSSDAPAPITPTVPKVDVPPVAVEPKPTAAELKAWSKLDGSTDPQAVRAFIARYPSSPLVAAAQRRLEILERLARAQEEALRAEREAARQHEEEEKLRKSAEAEQKRLEKEAALLRAQEEQAKAAELKRQRAEAEAAARHREADERAKAAAELAERKAEAERAKAVEAAQRRKEAEERAQALAAARQKAAEDAAARKREAEEAAKIAAAAKTAREAEERERARVAQEAERQERARVSEAAAREKEAQERAKAAEMEARKKEASERAEALAVARRKAAEEATARKQEEEQAAKLAAAAKAARDAEERERVRQAQEEERQERSKAAEISAREKEAQERAKAAEMERRKAEAQAVSQRNREEKFKAAEAEQKRREAADDIKRRQAAAAAKSAAEEQAKQAAAAKAAAAKQRQDAEQARRVAEEAAENRKKVAEAARRNAERQAAAAAAAAEKRRQAAAQAKEAARNRAAQAAPVRAGVHPPVRARVEAQAAPARPAGGSSYGNAEIGASRLMSRMP